MEQRSPDCRHKKIIKMFPATQVLGVSGGGGGRKRTEVLSGMIVWNVLVLILLVLAVCVQGRGSAGPSEASSHLALRRSPRGESVKRQGVDSIGPEKSADKPTLAPLLAQGSNSGESQDSKKTADSSEEQEEKKEEGGAPQEGKGEGGETQPIPENKDGNTNSTKEDSGSEMLPSHIPSMSTEAVLRGFYVFVGIGVIVLIYIVIKLARLRKRRAPGKYRVLSHTDDQEMFPLAAGEGEDEEIFNAAHHQPRK